MDKNLREQDRPEPHGAFDHPALALALHEVSHHATGFEEPDRPTAEGIVATTEGAAIGMPPRADGEIPRTGLVERLLRRPSGGGASR